MRQEPAARDNELREPLTLVGLTRTESRIYLALLDSGQSQAGTISRKTGIHRRSVYDALERLIEKGLVSWIKENDERFYLAESPTRLSQIARQHADAVDGILPQLLARHGAKRSKEETRFYRGIEGLKAVLDDQIAVSAPVMVMGAARDASEILRFYLPRYTAARVGKRIRLSLLYAGKRVRQEPIPFSTVRYLPESYATPVSTNIYGDRVAIIVWSTEPVAVLIRNAAIAASYRAWFTLLWKQAAQ